MIGAIFATDESGGFGYKGGMPWSRIPEDFKHFKRVTVGGKIVMGRNTFDSMPPVANRKIITLTHSTPDITNCVYSSPSMTIEHEGNNFWVIGGPNVINAFKDECDYDVVYHSLIKGTHVSDVYCNYRYVINGMQLIATREYDRFTVYKYLNENKF